MMTIRKVTLAADHTCCKCRTVLAKGSVATRKTERAFTYYQRCHADGNGNVSWYYCDRHAPPDLDAAWVAWCAVESSDGSARHLVWWAIKGPGDKLLNTGLQAALRDRTWELQDGYGAPGVTPVQGWDWSSIRDSSDGAMIKMAASVRSILGMAT